MPNKTRGKTSFVRSIDFHHRKRSPLFDEIDMRDFRVMRKDCGFVLLFRIQFYCHCCDHFGLFSITDPGGFGCNVGLKIIEIDIDRGHVIWG